LFTLHTLLNAVICCSQLNTYGVLRLIPHEWIISHRCSWMAVYISCCNAQSKSHSDPLDISRYLYSINCPTVMCLPSGPRSYFLYIATTYFLYSHCLLSRILLLLSTRYAYTFVYSKLVRLTTSSQVGSKVFGFVVCRFHVATS
jgi:hypothetical protein